MDLYYNFQTKPLQYEFSCFQETFKPNHFPEVFIEGHIQRWINESIPGLSMESNLR